MRKYLLVKHNQGGFTLIEAIVGLLIFSMIIAAVLGSYSVLAKSIKSARERTVLATQASYYLELIRNMPYDNIGTLNGNPTGTLADSSNPIVNTTEGVVYNIYYEVTYMDDSADGTILAGTDPAPNDYKQVKLSIKNMVTTSVTKFITNVSPQGLEGMTNAGALYIRVFDANGQPISGADVNIVNTSLDPDIILNRTTDSTGSLIEVGLPASVNGYSVIVTKSGYSTDQTYPITVANPNPVKPDATIVNGQVTQVSFGIDLLANLTIRTVNSTCSAVSSVDINVKGSKLIGTSPDVLKYDQDHTSSAGAVNLNNIEWDNYVPTLDSSSIYTIYGTSPIQQVTVLPGSSQTFTFVLGPSSDNSLRLIVKDAGTGNAVEGATVRLVKNNGLDYDTTLITGGSVWQQFDWGGGGGQSDFVDATQYFSQDGSIDVDSVVTGLQLNQVAGVYANSGYLESSTFDTGASSNFTTISWLPTSQNPLTSIRFQLAANNDNTTWNFVGPDGTSGSYYTTPGTNIASVHDNNRYMRYKVYLDTTDTTFTPFLSNVGINYVSGCSTPGQVIFPELTAGNDYNLTITMPGYSTYTENSINLIGNMANEVMLSP